MFVESLIEAFKKRNIKLKLRNEFGEIQENRLKNMDPFDEPAIQNVVKICCCFFKFELT